MCIKLSPLKRVEESWTKYISGPDHAAIASHAEDGTVNSGSLAPPRAPEVYVRSGQGWRGLMRFRRQSESAPRPPEVVEDEQNRHILAACASDIIAFWQHPKVQRIMEDRKIGLRGEPGLCAPIQLLCMFPADLVLLQLPRRCRTNSCSGL